MNSSRISFLSLSIILLFVLGGCSNKTTVSNGPPQAPTSLLGEATPVTSIVSLAWLDNSNNEAGFIVTSILDSALFRADTIGPNVVSYNYPGLYDSTTYSFYVNAFNAQGMSAPTNTIILITHHDSSVPVPPSYPWPHDGDSLISVNILPQWRCGDPHGDPIVYDVFFDTLTPPHWVIRQDSLTYIPSIPLLTLKTYFWRVVATDSVQNIITGPVWHFTTGTH